MSLNNRSWDRRLKLFTVEILADLLEDDDLYSLVREWERTERGSLPSYTEALIILWQVRNTKTLIWPRIVLGSLIYIHQKLLVLRYKVPLIQLILTFEPSLIPLILPHKLPLIHNTADFKRQNQLYEIKSSFAILDNPWWWESWLIVSCSGLFAVAGHQGGL